MLSFKRLLFLFIGGVLLAVVLGALTQAASTQLKNDNGVFYAGSYAGRIQGDIDGAVFAPHPDLFPITLQSVEFAFHQSPSAPWISDSARVRVQVYAMEGGAPGDILRESQPEIFSVTDDWLSLSLPDPLTLDEPASFMAAVKWESGSEEERALPLAMDSNFGAPQVEKDQKNLYHRRYWPAACRAGFCTHSELYDPAEGAEGVGFNMIRVTIDTPLAPTQTPGGATATPTSRPAPGIMNVYLPVLLRNYMAYTTALAVGEGPDEAASYALTSGDGMADQCWPGIDNNLWVGRESADGRGVMRSVIKFSLDDVPRNATLVQASLRLVAVEAGADTEPMTVSVHDITRPWGGCPTWNTLADAVGESWGDLSVRPYVGMYTVDVTPLVGRWLTDDLPNNGFMLRGDEEQVGRLRGFVPTASSYQDLRPRLLIRYRGQ